MDTPSDPTVIDVDNCSGEHVVIMDSRNQQRFNAFAAIPFVFAFGSILHFMNELTLWMIAMLILLLIGAWATYFHHQVSPTIWRISVTANELRYEKNGMLIETVLRDSVRRVRFEQTKLFKYLNWEEHASLKLDLADSSVHYVSYFRIYSRDVHKLVDAIQNCWGSDVLAENLR